MQSQHEASSLSWNSSFRFAICALLLISVGQSAAQTQSLRAMLARPSVADAMADAYGRAIISGIAKAVSEQGDANCLKSRKLDQAALVRNIQALLVRYGNKLIAPQADRVSEEALA